METEKQYKCIRAFEGFTGKTYTLGLVYPESKIHIFGQSNFLWHFEVLPETKIETEVELKATRHCDRNITVQYMPHGLTTYDGCDCVEYDPQQLLQLRDFLNQLDLPKN